MDGDPVGGDAEVVPPAQVGGAAELAHLQFARRTQADVLVAQLEQPIDQRFFRMLACTVARRDQHAGGGDEVQKRMQLLEEALEGQRQLGRCLRAWPARRGRRSEALVVAHGLLEQVQQRAQAALLQRRSTAEVDQGIADGRRVEEAERLEVDQHAGMQLGQQRDIDDAATGGDVVEGELVDQDGLAGAGRAGDEVEAAAQQAAAQHGIEAGHPGREADEWTRGTGTIGHGRILLRTRAGWTSQAQQPPPPWTTRAGGPRMARIIPGRASGWYACGCAGSA